MLENRAPAAGLPAIVINGSGVDPTKPGENRLYLSVYSPFDAASVTVDDKTVPFESARELGRHVYSTFMTIAPGAKKTVRVRLVGNVGPSPHYSLLIGKQPTVRPDDMRVTVRGDGVTRHPMLSSVGSLSEDRLFAPFAP